MDILSFFTVSRQYKKGIYIKKDRIAVFSRIVYSMAGAKKRAAPMEQREKYAAPDLLTI